MPSRGLFPPCLGALVMLSPRTKAHPRHAVQPRLERIRREDEAVHPFAECPVAHDLEPRRVIQPLFVARRGESFGRENAFAIGVRR